MSYAKYPAGPFVAKEFTFTPAAKSTTNVHAAFNGATVSNSFPGAFTNPDIPRNVRVTFSGAWANGDVTVTGTGLRGESVSETIADSAGSTVVGTKIFATVTAATKETAGVAATGSITCATKANLVDGETFVLNDGTNPAVTFEFDVAGDGVTGGRTAVNVSTDTTAAEVAARVVAAINGVGAGLAITATDAGSGVVTLANDSAGAAGNVAITETVVHASFVVAGMTGGVGAGTASIGTGDKIGLATAPYSAFGILTVDGTSEAVTVSTTASHEAFTPTTAPNGAKVFVIAYNTVL